MAANKTKKPINKSHVTVSIRKEHREAGNQLAEQNGISFTDVVDTALDRYLTAIGVIDDVRTREIQKIREIEKHEAPKAFDALQDALEGTSADGR